MSKGKKWKTPKKHHKDIDSWHPDDSYPPKSYFIHSKRYIGQYHVGSGRRGKWHKWYFRHKKYFKKWMGRMSMRKPMSIEIWYWD